MQIPLWILARWPGLLPLWRFGEVTGLIQACGFAVLLDLCLLATWIWPAWLEPSVQQSLCLVTVGYWIVSEMWWRWRTRGPESLFQGSGDLFVRAQGEYLRGDGYGAEKTVRSLLRWRPDDLEARLLLVSLLRHSRRWDEARAELRRLQRLAADTAWQPEMAHEWMLIEKHATAEQDGPGQEGSRKQMSAA